MFDIKRSVFMIPSLAASNRIPIANENEQTGKHRQLDVAYFYSYNGNKHKQNRAFGNNTSAAQGRHGKGVGRNCSGITCNR